jgi:polysaccharide export outer membrane protein
MANMRAWGYVWFSMCTASTRFWSFCIVVLLLGCGPHHGDASALYAEAARNDPRGRPFVIDVSDVVRVTVWKEPGLSADVAVLLDGTITLPLVGEIVAKGATAAALQQKIAERLGAFVKDPVVTVAVVEVNSYRFTVAGNVEHPGMFTPKDYVTLSQAIALAGGPNRYADSSDIVIVRGGRRIPVDYDAIVAGKSPEQDLVVLSGDAVRVP